MPPLSADLFDYHLPAHLIAQTPAARRDGSRLMVIDRATRTFSHHAFADLHRFLREGDTLFRNNASVLPARLHARRPTGGQVECFLLRPTEGHSATTWQCLIKPGKKLAVGATFADAAGTFQAEIISRETDGSAFVQFKTLNGESVTALANRVGEVPLPPYIERSNVPSFAPTTTSLDRDRYQTVYANPERQVAVAAPTAGLHFTPEILAALRAQGVFTADLTLHVGLGTFKPITAKMVEDHAIHRELYEIPVTTQRALFPPLPGRRIAVGTTSVRSIENFLAHHPAARETPQVAEASIYIYPPRAFRGIDALITNFHQPRSTLLCLVSAFLTPGSTDGVGWLHSIYAEAIAREYRFLSYGDAMLIL